MLLYYAEWFMCLTHSKHPYSGCHCGNARIHLLDSNIVLKQCLGTEKPASWSPELCHCSAGILCTKPRAVILLFFTYLLNTFLVCVFCILTQLQTSQKWELSPKCLVQIWDSPYYLSADSLILHPEYFPAKGATWTPSLISANGK